MSVKALLFQIGRAAVKVGANLVVPGSGIAVEVASEVIEERREQHRLEELREELDEVLATNQADFDDAVQAAVVDLKQELQEQWSQEFAGYLQQLKSSVERGARVQGDPTGKTVPRTVNVTEAVSLASFLPERPPQFQPGDHVPGRRSWRLERLLGAGGFGEVWQARHEMMGNLAAFKFFLDPHARQRFSRHEARVISQIMQQGPLDGIVNLLDAEPHGDPPWLQFEYADGGDLTTLLGTLQRLPQKRRTALSLKLLKFLAEKVGYFHCLSPAIVHRDLKPGNILLKEKHPLIADFGIGVILESELTEQIRKTQASAGFTTIQACSALYASPQQKNGRKPDVRDDVYALGVIGYQMLREDWTLPPPTGEGWKRVLSERSVPDSVISLLGRCWDAEIDERPAHGLEFAEALAAILDPETNANPAEEVVEAAPPPQPARAVRQQRKPGNSFAGKIAGDLWDKNDLAMPFCWCPPGTFTMGSPESEADRNAEREAQVKVTLSNGFWLGQYEVTQGEWEKLMGTDVDDQRQKASFSKLYGAGASHPMYYVSWDEAMGFCQKLTEQERKAGRLPVDWVYTLPTEAQWEYACRAGTTTATAFGNSLSSTQANFDGNYQYNGGVKGSYKEETVSVGSYKPNAWNLYDMHGNVLEWCRDYYADKLPGGTDPETLERSTYRVSRGGGWGYYGQSCRSANRYGLTPEFRSDSLGFRVAAVQQD